MGSWSGGKGPNMPTGAKRAGYGTPWALLGTALIVIAVGLIMPAAGSAAPKAKLGSFGVPNGSQGGQVSFSRGLAVNRSGAGVGAPAGTVYIAEGNPNHRISQFDGDGNFIRAWGYDVVKAGAPNDNGTGFEICDVTNGNASSDCKSGVAGVAAGQLNNPVSIAVDETNGYLYVTSQTNRRVDVFAPTGQFAGAFGWGVDTGVAALEVCTTASGCQAAAPAGAQAGNLQNLIGSAPAIDPTASSGTLYVPDIGNARVASYQTSVVAGVLAGATFINAFGWDVANTGDPGDTAPVNQLEVCTTNCKAGTSGNGAGQFGPLNTGSPTSAAIDSTGAIYVTTGPLIAGNCSTANPCRVQKFASDLSSAADFGPTDGLGQLFFTAGGSNASAALAVSVDLATNHVFVLRKSSTSTFRIVELDSAGTYVETHPGLAAAALPGATTNLGPGLGVGTDGRLYASLGAPNGGEIYIVGDVPAPDAEMTGIEDITSASATFKGAVTVPAPGGPGFEVSYHFEYSRNGKDWIRLPTIDQITDNVAGTYDVVERVRGLEPNAVYLVRLVATTGTEAISDTVTFETSPAPPSVQLTFVDDVTQNTATLAAQVRSGGLKSSYWFEWGETEAYGHRTPAAFDRQLGGGNDLVLAKEPVTGLSPKSTYHFRVIAKNAAGETVGPDQRFETLNECGLTNDRCFELVSPADKGAVGGAGEQITTGQELRFQASPSSAQPGLAYVIAYGLPDASAGGELVYRSLREPTGWQAEQLSAPALRSAVTQGEAAYPSRTLALTPDLMCGIQVSPQPLTADTPQATIEAGVANLFRRTAAGEWTVITENVPLNLAPSSAWPTDYELIGMSKGDGCERVIFRTTFRYPDVQGAGTARVYEWEAGSLRNVGIVPGPGGYEAAEAIPGMSSNQGADNLGDQSFAANAWNAVSDDASRIVITAVSRTGDDVGQQAIFVRDRAAGTGDFTAGATTVSGIDQRVGRFAPGMEVNGPGISAGTEIVAVGPGEGVIELSEPVTQSGVAVPLEALRSIDVSQSQAADLPMGAPNNDDSMYQIATPDGEHVFFTARYGLAANEAHNAAHTSLGATACAATGAGCDLYRYSLDSERLVDLSVPESDADAASTGGAGVIGVLAASDDGERVYFAALGQLVRDVGRTATENAQQDTFNIYLSDEGNLSFIGLGRNEDRSRLLVANSTGVGQAGTWTSRSTPSGSHLLFESRAPVTGHQSEGQPEAYLYNAGTADVVCVSCRRDGLPSINPHVGPNGVGPIVPGVAVANRLNPPRALSDDGRRVYFISRDRLATGATEGKPNLYQWEEGQISFIASSVPGSSRELQFAGASRDGGHIYFSTLDRLTWQDIDGQLDVYDAIVGGGIEPPPPPVECDPLGEAACQGPGSAPMGSRPSGSASLFGVGNVVPERGNRGKHRKRSGKKKKAGKKKAGKKKAGKKKCRKRGCRRGSGRENQSRAIKRVRANGNRGEVK